MKKIIMLMYVLLLSGCATYGTEFQCKEGKGLGCTSSSKVIELLETNRIYEAIDEKNSNKKKNCTNCFGKEEVEERAKLDAAFLRNLEVEESKSTTFALVKPIARSNEKVIKIWFNEYVDESGNLNGEQVVYTVIEASKWLQQ